MHRLSQGVVAVVFFVLAVSFIFTTATLYNEFSQHSWFTIAVFSSHLFLFFPTFGILALFAFFIPASALLDLCWNHVRYGKIRFLLGTTFLVVVSIGISSALITGVPAVWWLTPETLASDAGQPEGCKPSQSTGTTATQARTCARLPILESVAEVRNVSMQRTGLSPFVRSCKVDDLLEVAPELSQKRHCFITKTKLTAADCCQAQELFRKDLTQLYDQERAHSLTGRAHAMLLPLKIFFLLMILSIGFLLAMWRRTIDKHYAPHTGRIERGILIGAFAMLVWPIANHGYLQSATLLYGIEGVGIYGTISPIMSFLFAAWTLLLVLFFFRQHRRDVEAAGIDAASRIFGGLASGLAFLKYNEIIDFATRVIGSGAEPWVLSMIALLLLAGFAGLFVGIAPANPSASTESA